MTLGRWLDTDTGITCVCFGFGSVVYVHQNDGYITEIPRKLFDKLTKNGNWRKS